MIPSKRPLDIEYYRPNVPIAEEPPRRPLEVEHYNPTKRTAIQEIGRHAARSAARAGETALGLPGDLTQIANSAIKGLVNSAVQSPIGQAILGQGQHPELAENIDIGKLVSPLGAPTSADIREQTKKIGEGFLEPQSEAEKFSDEIISDLTALAIPIKGKIPFLRTLGTAIGSNLIGKGAEMLGAGERTKTAAKLGSMFLLTAVNPKGAEKYANDLYAEAKKLVPKNATVPAKSLQKQIGALREQLKKGGTAPYKAPALTKLNEIQSKIKYGQIPVDELTEFKIDINKARSGLYGDVNLDKGGRAIAKRNLDSTAKIVDNALRDYGEINPAWAHKYRPANDAYGAIAQSKKVSSAISRFISKHPASSIATLGAELFLAPKTVPAALAGFGALKSGELIARVIKSPELRKYYSNIVAAALKDDSIAIARNLEKIQKWGEKESNAPARHAKRNAPQII